jgi:hypothetical protein
MVERILPLFQRGEKANGRVTLLKSWPDNLPLCRLSSSAKDTLTLADAKTGVLITGQTGRGKTSGPGRLLAKAYLRAGFGGLVLCAKIDEADLWRNICAKPTGSSSGKTAITRSIFSPTSRSLLVPISRKIS